MQQSYLPYAASSPTQRSDRRESEAPSSISRLEPKAKAPSSANTPGPDSKSRMITSISESLQEGSLLVSGRAERGGPQFSNRPTVHLKLTLPRRREPMAVLLKVASGPGAGRVSTRGAPGGPSRAPPLQRQAHGAAASTQLHFNEKRPLAPRRRARLSARSMSLGPCARVDSGPIPQNAFGTCKSQRPAAVLLDSPHASGMHDPGRSYGFTMMRR